MTLREKIKVVPGLQYVADELNVMSSAGRRKMLEQELFTDETLLEQEWERTQAFADTLQGHASSKAMTSLRHQMMQLHDLQGTLRNLQSHIVLDEVELFEIKNLAYISTLARRDLLELGLDRHVCLPDLQPVFALLDPDQTGMPNFYIYDSYDIRLAPLRKQMKAAAPEEMGQLVEEQNAIQQQVILQLCDKLAAHCSDLSTAMELMAYTDYAIAKAEQALQWGLCRPALGKGTTSFLMLFNPRLKQHNESKGLRYQPVDIALKEGVCLITGANMAGKTVLLKSVGIAQLMAQFGMFVPAKEATVSLVNDIVLCIGDEQNEMNGLSSFASEIINISECLKRSASERLMVLIDEPARTTNPIEGKAIVQSIATIMESRDSITLVTTHYSQLGIARCQRLRVKGFTETLSDIPLTPESINRFIDYSLTPDTSDEVPQEALRIAAILQCDSEMLEKAKGFLNSNTL